MFFCCVKHDNLEMELCHFKSVFGSVVTVAFQIAFRVEIHVNDIFLFFKKSFLISAHQNDPKSTNRIQF
jgi:hypothetical protein